MAKVIKPLTDLDCKRAKPREKDYKMFDGGGLFLAVLKSGKKKWRIKYKLEDKESIYSVGDYPQVSLSDARKAKEVFLKDLENGLVVKKKDKKSTLLKDIIKEWFEHRSDMKPTYKRDSIAKIEKNIIPYLGNKDINDIEPLEMLKALQIIDQRGSNHSARKTYGLMNRMYKYAVLMGKAKHNILADIDISIAFSKRAEKNMAHITDTKVLAEFLRKVDSYGGDYSTKMALKIIAHLFVRPYNLRFMEWNEIDFENKMWIIPAEKMKMNKAHMVPLSDYVISVLNEMKVVSYDISTYVFPSRINYKKTLSENTFNKGVKTLGFDSTAHGFRHTASTLLHENMRIHGINSAAIETQLAHTVGNSIHQTYNKAIYLEDRIKLMSWWSDYLNKLKNGS